MTSLPAASGGSASGGAWSRGGGAGGGGGANRTGGAGSTQGTGGNGGSVGSGGGAGPGGGGVGGAATASAGAGGSRGGNGGGAGGASAPAAATIVPAPSWACGMAQGIPPATQGELVFRASLQVAGTHDAGTTQYGHRRILDVGGGTVTGAKVTATVLTGGFDFELTLSNGVVQLEQIDLLRASDGTLILMRNCGMAAAAGAEMRIVLDFEVATSSPLAWLGTGKFVGTRTVDSAGTTMQLDVYDVSKVTAGEPKIQLVAPSDRPAQPWDCSTATGARGASVFTENVTLGGSLSIGATKRGTRNIIPITGGTVTGRVSGTVIPGGADYQLLGGTTRLDARYVVSSRDGEFVLVRNCGPIGALVPLFETRADGPYAFLNENRFVSADPGSGAGGVSITFYERK